MKLIKTIKCLGKNIKIKLDTRVLPEVVKVATNFIHLAAASHHFESFFGDYQYYFHQYHQH